MASQILANLKQQVAGGRKEGQQKTRPHQEVKARTATALRVNERKYDTDFCILEGSYFKA